MTRINCIPVSELTDKHLLAEYRELPRVFGLVRRAVERGEAPDDPRNPVWYTLGKGHVRFFYSRLSYCEGRFYELRAELRRRDFEPQYKHPPDVGHIPFQWYGHWEPTRSAKAINRARIRAKLALSEARKAEK